GERSRAFLDVVTDGCVRWSGPFSHVAAGFEGIALDGLVRWLETGLYDRRPVVTGPIVRRAPRTVRDATLALEVRPKALKAVLPGPVTLARVSRDDHYGDLRGRARAFPAALHDEARDLAAAGVRVLQVDEPLLGRRPEDLDLVVETVGAVFSGASPETATILATYFCDLEPLGD